MTTSTHACPYWLWEPSVRATSNFNAPKKKKKLLNQRFLFHVSCFAKCSLSNKQTKKGESNFLGEKLSCHIGHFSFICVLVSLGFGTLLLFICGSKLSVPPPPLPFLNIWQFCFCIFLPILILLLQHKWFGFCYPCSFMLFWKKLLTAALLRLI